MPFLKLFQHEVSEAQAFAVASCPHPCESDKTAHKENTDDSHPGIYQMANFWSEPDMTPDEVADKVFPRALMVSAFGDTGFPLEVGEIGMAEYDPQSSKYGWHIIKRIR